MNMQELQKNPRVRIVGDALLTNTDLDNASGLVVKVDSLFVNVIITSGKLIGQTHRFIPTQLSQMM